MKGGERAGRGEEELKKVSKSWTPKGRAGRVGGGERKDWGIRDNLEPRNGPGLVLIYHQNLSKVLLKS